MNETRTTTRLLAELIIAANVVMGTVVFQAVTADASHVDAGHGLQGSCGATMGYHHHCHLQATRSPRCDIGHVTTAQTSRIAGTDDELMKLGGGNCHA